MYSHILFDLDGTLIKSHLGIINGMKKSFESVGLKNYNENDLMHCIGPSLYDTYVKKYNMTEEEYQVALKAFRAYYKEKGMYECELYFGIEDMLKKLTENGKKIYIATSKPEFQAVAIIDNLKLNKYFTYVGGADEDNGGLRSTKAKVIEYVLTKDEFPDKKNIIMVGDKSHDIIGAKENYLDTIGVTYGYGDKLEHEKAGADYIFATVKEVEDFLLMKG